MEPATATIAITITVTEAQLRDLRKIKELVEQRARHRLGEDEYLELDKAIEDGLHESEADMDTIYTMVLDNLPS